MTNAATPEQQLANTEPPKGEPRRELLGPAELVPMVGNENPYAEDLVLPPRFPDPSPTPPGLEPLALRGPEEVEMFEPHAGQKKAQYSWNLWTMNYLPTKASEEAALKVDESIAESKRWREHADEAQRIKEAAESRTAEALVEVERAKQNAAWQSEILETEHTQRVEALEELLETERRARAREKATLENLVKEERERCEERISYEKKRAAEEQRRLTSIAEEAEKEAMEARERAEQEIEKAKAEQRRRVQEAQKRADEHVRQVTEEKDREIARMNAWVSERTAQLQEACAKYLKEKEETDRAAKGLVDAAETRILEQREKEKAELNRLADRFEEWRVAKESHYQNRPRPLEMKEKADAFWRQQAAMRMEQNVTWAVSQELPGGEECPGSPTRASWERKPGTGLKLIDGFQAAGQNGAAAATA